jgi:hypothetical protein
VNRVVVLGWFVIVAGVGLVWYGSGNG